ncbi:MAG: glycine cleavage system protein GcvH [Bdellovibrionota bacterium]
MDIPANLSYTEDHEWISNKTGTAKVGISAFAVEQLGDIVYVELPDIGSSFATGEAFGTVESTKTVSDLNMPLAGKIIEINQDIVDSPESLQEDSYRDGWLIKVEISSDEGADSLMDSEAYEKFIKDNH